MLACRAIGEVVSAARYVLYPLGAKTAHGRMAGLAGVDAVDPPQAARTPGPLVARFSVDAARPSMGRGDTAAEPNGRP